MIYKGFRLGMVLQLAIGPVCLFIFQTSVNAGFFNAFLGVIGVVLVDGLFILSAILGLGALLEKNRSLKSKLGYLGGTILIIFGLSTVINIFGIAMIPSFSLNTKTTSNILIKTFLMTLSNPLTIIFWAGMFTASLETENLNSRQVYEFGLGALSATLIFMSSVALLGSSLSIFISDFFLKGLNLCTGLFLIGFGIRSLIKNYKDQNYKDQNYKNQNYKNQTHEVQNR
ncbi:LysE family translocator [Fusibacter ferrireducens]|uniref:LysE family transporter n=1 Tax=Fusibacter ferrireducens TaxID=2785058 RepID=A0ABR9ZQP5_9FIRM|nr:LysE family transporter [Fusibacter ferrireducens]MBF4692463.1 LysE family transporter [Fusibacter ferrireducens]